MTLPTKRMTSPLLATRAETFSPTRVSHKVMVPIFSAFQTKLQRILHVVQVVCPFKIFPSCYIT